MLQFKDMPLCRPMRAVFKAFSLLEMLIVLSLIGIITALLIPNIVQARQEALRQTVRQQVKMIEKALADWYSSRDSIVEASNIWDNNFNGAGGYATPSRLVDTAVTSNAINIRPYISSTQNDVSYTSPDGSTYGVNRQAGGFLFGTLVAFTREMENLPLSAGGAFIGGNTGAANDYPGGVQRPHAYVRFFWQPDNAATTGVNERLNSAPEVRVFLPSN